MFLTIITGPNRSGTSAMCWALRKTRYRGPAEGHLLDLIGEIGSSIDKYYDRKKFARNNSANLIHFADEINIKKRIGEAFYRFYAESAVKSISSQVMINFKVKSEFFFVDKTPSLDFRQTIREIDSVFDNVNYIFCKRRGIENVVSRMEKWPDRNMKYYTESWSKIMDSWYNNREIISGKYLEIDQYDMWRTPSKTSNLVKNFLNLSEEEEIIIRNSLQHDRVQKTSDSYAPLNFDQLEWSDEEKQIFMDNCGDTMENFGYSYDETYRHTIEDSH